MPPSDLCTAQHSVIKPVLVRMSDVRPVPLRWLWPDRVPLGKLTLIAGDPGRGKSLLTIDIAARITTGRAFPDGTHCSHGPGGVLFISAEDDLGDTVRPRLDAAGADASRVMAMQGVSCAGREEHVTLRDLDAISQALDALEDARLIVIDPISAYLGDADDHKN
ncbi:MAG: AAA family ATPase, partial [Phycisphaerales bacterium]|nr:AAA family ATPase [Phycisphaerales bacterium]